MSRAKLNYIVDFVVGIAFLSSAVSGLIFLVPASVDWGTSAGVLGITYRLWNEVHTWSSLVMIVGVVTHLVLHWKWIVTMTKRLMPAINRPIMKAGADHPLPMAVANGGIGRRDFLRFGGMAMVGIVLLLAGYRVSETIAPINIDNNDHSEAPPTDVTTQLSQQQTGTNSGQPAVAATATVTPSESPAVVSADCPFGLVNDPYPGRCRFYTDANHNGLCDHSEPS